MRVSVLLPVRNGARHLGSALRSLERQTRPADQVVIIDDASADATHAVIRCWKKRLPLTVVLGEGRGIARALNAGLPWCVSDVVARMDGDDVMHPARLETQVAHLETHPDQSVCGTEVLSFPPSRVSEKRTAYDRYGKAAFQGGGVGFLPNPDAAEFNNSGSGEGLIALHFERTHLVNGGAGVSLLGQERKK